MSIWTRIADALSSLAKGEGLSSVFEKLRTPPERSVAFAIAVIGLGAKMAKADGTVTRDEVTAFRRVFAIPEEGEANAARVYNLARQDVAGFDAYARKIAALFNSTGAALCAVAWRHVERPLAAAVFWGALLWGFGARALHPGAVAGALGAALFGLLVIWLNTNQYATGLAISLFGGGFLPT